MKQLRLLIVAAIASATVIGCAGGSPGESSGPDPTAPQGVALPATATAQIEALLSEKAARSPAQRKISSALLYAKSGRFDANILKPGAVAKAGDENKIQSLLQVDKDGRVLTDIKGDLDGGLLSRIEAVDGKVVASSPEHRSVRAWLHLASIESFADHPVVNAIRPALLARTDRADSPRGQKVQLTREQRVALVQKYVQQAQAKAARQGSSQKSAQQATLAAVAADGEGAATNAGAANSEGGVAHGVDRARKFYNTDGTGIKVGVLSDSDDLKEQSIASGDLPADTVTVPGQSGRPGSGEGTAMMEIVHDIAPGAQIFFASAFESPEAFAENIRTLRFTYHCDIIVDDVIYYFESPYQDDIIAAAVDDVTRDGALYFSSAGNQGNYDDGTSGTWEGDFSAGGSLATLPSGYTVHDFGQGVISNRVEAFSGPIVLHWSDPGSLDLPLSSNDYDVFVLDQDLRNVAVASTDVQDGDDLPFEFVGFLIPPDFRIVVAKKPSAQKRAIHLASFGELGLSTPGGSYGHNSAEQAFGVAAVDVFEAGAGEFIAGPTTPVELYSADGNRWVFYDRNGVKIRGGVTFASGGGKQRLKPDITAADGVSTTLPPTSGLNPFFGTSAAAPHAAAIAALIKAAVPNIPQQIVRDALQFGALDIEAKDIDRDSGFGIVSAPNALRQAGALPAVFLEQGTITTTPSSGDAVVPGGGGSIVVQLVNNGGQRASNVTSTLATTSAGVTITSANSAYPNINAGGNAVNTTPYQFTVAPTTTCGAKLNFTQTVRFTGRGTNPKLFNLAVQTGRVSPTPAIFSYGGGPVAIPDDDIAGVDIPLVISGSSAASQIGFDIGGSSCSAAIGSTTVGVDHTWVGDLIFTLRSPAGTSVRVINQAGSANNSGNNFCQTLLRDGAANSIQNVTPAQNPYTGTFAPANPQAAFVGENANGTWNLNVSDNAFIDTGTVRSFSVEVSGFSCTP